MGTACVHGGVAMSFLEVQTSPGRTKALRREIDRALRQAGPPYRRLAVAARDHGKRGVHVEVMALGVFLTRLEQASKGESTEEARVWLRGCLATARGYYDRRLIPEWVTFAEGGAELNNITPPEGTW